MRCAMLAGLGGALSCNSSAGGVVIDGTYVLTRWDVYPPGLATRLLGEKKGS